MASTTHYGITLLEQAQAQKEVTINEALGVIDAMLKGSVMDKDLAAPPGSPANGDGYIVAASPTGAWSGKAKHIAYYDQVWRFVAPVAGVRIWVSDEACYYQYNGSSWATSNPAITGNASTATALQTPRTINGVAFDGTANITISASMPNLTGEVTSVGSATTVTNSAVIGKVLTGYSSGAGAVSASDTILQAVQKLNGNIALKAPIASPAFTGTVSGITAAMVGAPSGSGTCSGSNTGDQTITLTGDVTGSGTGSFAATIGGNKVTNAMLAQVGTGVFKGRTSAGTGNVEDLSASQATALLDVMVGDSGSGGTKGLVPAPGPGDATKFLTGAGTYVTVSGGGGGGSGTVTTVSVSGANGVSASVSSPASTPAISIGLGAITPTSVAATGTVTGSNLSGTNTGDQTTITGNAGTATKLQTARMINGVAFDGSADITISAAAAANLLTGTTLAAGVVSSSLTGVGTLTSGTWNGSAIGAAYGGTGQASYTTGDMLYASGSTALAKLAGVATGNVLLSGGVGTAPGWGKVDMASHITGTLAVANGGTGGSSATGSGAVVLATSPALTGTPTAPTAAAGTSTTQIATTAFALANNFTLSSTVASTSGTAIDFTGIPSTARVLILNLNQVSSSGTSHFLIQLGKSGGVETSGYSSSSCRLLDGLAVAVGNYTSGFGITLATGESSNNRQGSVILTLMDVTNNLWACRYSINSAGTILVQLGSGTKALSGVLDRVRLTTAGGTDTFDNGSVNLMWG